MLLRFMFVTRCGQTTMQVLQWRPLLPALETFMEPRKFTEPKDADKRNAIYQMIRQRIRRMKNGKTEEELVELRRSARACFNRVYFCLFIENNEGTD